MVHAIRTLYDANVRKIISTGILPLGCTPRVVWEWYNSTAIHHGMGCVEEINELVLQYNTMLNEHIVELNVELPDAKIIFCDVYQGMMEVITNPTLFGTNPFSLFPFLRNSSLKLLHQLLPIYA
jgi:phospholipase/lecithinase/hemolysin